MSHPSSHSSAPSRARQFGRLMLSVGWFFAANAFGAGTIFTDQNYGAGVHVTLQSGALLNFASGSRIQIDGVNIGANQIVYSDGSQNVAKATAVSFGIGLVSKNDAAAVRSYIGAQVQNAVLDSFVTSAGHVDWTKIDNKPATFTPSVHTHAQSDIVGLVAALAAKQDALGFTAENAANKATSTSLGTSDTLYPSQKAVKTYVDTVTGGLVTGSGDASIDGVKTFTSAPVVPDNSFSESKVANLASDLAARELIANKSANVLLGTSSTLYPTQGAVKMYVDNGLLGKQGQSLVLDSFVAAAGHVDWAKIDNKPSTFAPSAHTHPQSDVTGLVAALAAKQNSLGFTPENVSNKSAGTSLGTSNTLYPTQGAVKSYVDTAIAGISGGGTSFIADAPLLLSGGHLSIPLASATASGYVSAADWSTFNSKQSALGFTAENSANKSTSASLGTSATLYPSQGAVKSYVDTVVGGLVSTSDTRLTDARAANAIKTLSTISISTATDPTDLQALVYDAGLGKWRPGTVSGGGAANDFPQFIRVGIGQAPDAANPFSINAVANAVTLMKLKRFTDSSPTGNFADFQSAAGSSLWRIDIAGILQAGNVPVARVTGLAAVATSGSATDLAIGTLPNARLSGVPNSSLLNSAITLQDVSVPLGGNALGTTSTPRFLRLGLNQAADANSPLAITGAANNITLMLLKRNTDVSATGSFQDFQTASGTTSLWKVGIDGTLNAGVIPIARLNGIIPIANGGTGTASPVITAGSGITVTGSWPNVTITATGSGGLSSITLNTSLLHTSPVTFTNTSGAWSGTETLANQAANTVFGNFTSGSAAPAFAKVTDGAMASLRKPDVAVVAVVNLTLSGEQTIDGVTTSGSLVLATAQTTGSQNGPWVTGTGAWTRPSWYSAGSTTQAPQYLSLSIQQGTTYQGSLWRMTTSGVTIDTTATTWAIVPRALNSNTVAGGTPLTTTGSPASGDLAKFSGSTTLTKAVAGTDVTTPLSAESPQNKTIDTVNTNTIKRFDYMPLMFADNSDGTNAVRVTTEGATYGHFAFSNSAAKASNYIIYRTHVPKNLNTAVDLAASLKFRLGGADAGKHSYYISMADVPDSASADNPTFSNEVAMSFAGDASGASGDTETVNNVTLTSWRSSLTAGDELVIKVARDGSDGTLDTSTVNSTDLGLTVRYGISSTSSQ